MIIIVGCFAQTLAGEAESVNVFAVIIVWRFIVRIFFFSRRQLKLYLIQMGIGIGGDYPLSAVISSEFSSTKIRGRLMTTVFSAQGWGQLSSLINDNCSGDESDLRLVKNF